MKFLSKLALAWMFAWLPVSGVVAATMPFCAQGMGGMMAATVAAEGMDSMPCHQPADASSKGGQLPVEHCDLCHVAGAVAPPSLPVIANVPPSLPPSVDRVEDFSSFIPATPQRPPHTAPA